MTDSDYTVDQRRKAEVELLLTKGFMRLIELAHQVNASESTVRRDLEILQGQGLVRRTRGGALGVKEPGLSVPGAAGIEAPFLIEKQAIAAAVAELVRPGQTLLLNGGTTCLQVATALRGRRLNVVTNSVAIASMLSGELATEVTAIGGYVYPRVGVAVGPTAQEQLATMAAGQLVTSCAGLTAEGVFEANVMMADVQRLMIRAADEVILAVDHTKLGMRSLVKLCELAELDVIVTDAAADDEARRWLATLDVRVIYA